MQRRVVYGLGFLALVVLLAVGGVAAWQFIAKEPFEQAVASMPAQTLRATYTDWSQVREVSGPVGPGASSRDVDEFLDRAYDADLTSTSAVTGSTYALQEHFGVSPLTATWEMYGQSRDGAVDVLRFGEGTDLGEVEGNLRELGYTEPASGSGGVWTASVDLVPQIDPALTPIVQNVVVLEDEGVVLLSDDAGYASMSADVLTGSEESLWSEPGASSLAGIPSAPVSAVLLASDFACEALSMGSAGEEDQVLADALVEAAGEISPLSGLVMAHERDRTMVVGMQFESGDQAERNLRPRVELASGDAVGQGGTFPDRFRISSAKADGENVVLTLEPADADSALLSDLSNGPVLFATC